MTAIADEKYVRLTTFTKDGRPKGSPVWIADLGDGTIGFTTGLDSWKVKRIRNTAAVELAPSTMKGVVADGAEVSKGTATIETEHDRVAAAIKAKYGFSVTMIQMLEKAKSLVGRGSNASCGIVITLD